MDGTISSVADTAKLTKRMSFNLQELFEDLNQFATKFHLAFGGGKRGNRRQNAVENVEIRSAEWTGCLP